MPLSVHQSDAWLRGVDLDDPGTLLTLADQARDLATSDPRRALSLTDVLLERAEPGSAVMSRVLAVRAHALCYANDFAGAVEHLDRACLSAVGRGQDGEFGTLRLAQVQPLARLGRLVDAERAAREARERFERAGDGRMAAKSDINLGIVLRMQGRIAQSLECFDRARAGVSDDALPAAALESNRGEALRDLDRLDDAARAFERALELFQACGQAHAAAIVEGNLAEVCMRLGRVDEAVTRYEGAIARYRQAGADADAARLLGEEGEALLSVGARRKSARLLGEALPILERHGLTLETARASLALGVSLLRLGRARDARAHLERGAELAERAGAGLIAADARLALGESVLDAGDAGSARALAARACAALGDQPLRRAVALATGARIELADRAPGAALDLIDRADALLDGLEATPVRARLAHLRSRALAQGGDPAGGLAAARSAMELAERVRGSIRAEQVRTAYLESSHELYDDACAWALDLGGSAGLACAFDASERLRARTLLETVPAGAGPDPDAQERARCVAELDALYLSLGPGASRAGAGERARAAELEARLERLHDRRQSSGPSSVLGAAPMGLEEALAALPPGVAALSYVRDAGWISALVLSGGSARVRRRLCTLAEAEALVRRVRLDADRSALEPRGAADGMLRRVFEVLVAPVLGDVGACELLAVSPCRPLHALPLGAAVSVLAGATGLLTPGVTAGLRLGSAGADAGEALVVGVADEIAPRMEEEARRVAQGLGPGVRLLLAGEAGSGAFLDALRGAGLVHVACHGVFDGEFPMSSRLRLADRWVTAREIVGRLRPGAVVVLAGCETGRSPDWTGEDRFGLVRAFLASGASAVAASLWPLHDQTACGLFERVHAGGDRRGRGLAHALARAQREAHARSVGWALWGGVYVKGGLS